MTSQENYETLKATIESLKTDFEKFENKKVKAAGQRTRNHLLSIKKLCDTLRKQIISEMRDLPTKHRIIDNKEVKEEPEEVEKVKPEEVAEVKPEPEPEEIKPEKKKRQRKANKSKDE